jgi:ABC-2 type transport system ATP-binding protein
MSVQLPTSTSTDSAIIRTEALCKTFGKIQAVKDLTFEVKRGELFGIVGPDGAGKTTTMRIFAGILRPTSGQAWVDGISVSEDPESIKSHIAYMPQKFGLYSDLTVIENLTFYADLFSVPKKTRPHRIERLMQFSRLGQFKDRLAGALSGGMKQKLGLACALIHEPRLLLLDEPTNGVDPVSRRDFWKILYDLLKDGISIVITTAYLDEAERTNRVCFLNKGEIIELGEPHSIKSKITGIMVELTTDDPEKTKSVLRNSAKVLDFNVFGESIHVHLRDESVIEDVANDLLNQGIVVQLMTVIEPSMEDAFLALIPK